MKHLLLSGLLLCAGLTASAFDWTCNTNPAQGEVASLEVITLTFPGVPIVEVNSKDDFVLDYEGTTITTRTSYTDDDITVTLPAAATEPGTYTLTVASGAIAGYSGDYSIYEDNPSRLQFSWTITGGGSQGINFEATTDPAQGVVDKLGKITVTFPNTQEIEANSLGDLTFKCNGEAVAGATIKIPYGSKTITVTPSADLTAPGTYVLTVPAYSICGYDDSYNLTDLDKDLTFTWEIKGSATDLDFSYTATPAGGSTVGSLNDITLTFGALETVSLSGDVALKVNDVAQAAPQVTATGNTLKIVPAAAIASGNVSVTIKADQLTGKAGAVTAKAKQDIVLNYTVASAVSYTLKANFSNPKPNANNEISVAEKSLTSIFFYCDKKDIVVDPNPSGPNVTIRQAEGDFIATATLKKSYGLNFNSSYFMADFGKEPTQNGKYIITFDQGAFGDAAWAADHSLGVSNPEFTLEFTVIGGQGEQKVQYTFEGTVDPAEGEYNDAEVFKTVTVTFDQAVTGATDKAVATLKGNDYEQTAAFVLKEAGVFEATFTTLPATAGTYVLSVPEGVFGDTKFIDSKGEEGNTNTAIRAIYRFTGGGSLVTYELEGAVTPEAGNYENAADFTTVTVTFADETVDLLPGVKASLASEGYKAEAKFTAQGNGTFTATFEPAPTADGDYVLTIPEGAFGNVAFVTSQGEKGIGSKELTVTYTLKALTGIDAITVATLKGREVYNLNGVRLTNVENLPAGVYVVDGKKVFVK